MTTYAEAPAIDEIYSIAHDIGLSKLRRALEILEQRDYRRYAIVAEFFGMADRLRLERSYEDKWDRKEEYPYGEGYEV